MPATASRLSVFTESVIRGTTRLANQHGAINLAQGFPDFEPPEELLAALERAPRGPHHQYAVTWGAPRFREALHRTGDRSGPEPRRHLRQHRGDDGRDDDCLQSGRQGDHLLAVL
jgi:aminotransferase